MPKPTISLAWAMTSVPGQTTPFEIARGAGLGEESRRAEPRSNGCTGILWVWLPSVRETGNSRAESLEKSIDLNNGGGAIDFFFLAMTRWHQGKPEEAKKLFEQAATYRPAQSGRPRTETRFIKKPRRC